MKSFAVKIMFAVCATWKWAVLLLLPASLAAGAFEELLPGALLFAEIFKPSFVLPSVLCLFAVQRHFPIGRSIS